MKFKELLAKIVSGQVSDAEKNIFWDCVDNNDDLAESLLATQIPSILSIMCENNFIVKKPYIKKYGLIVRLHNAKMNMSDISFDLEQLKTEIVPFLTVENIDCLINQLQLRCDTIKTLMDLKSELRSKIEELNGKIASQKSRGKKEGGAEKAESNKKKKPSNLEIQVEDLKKRLAALQEQERLLVATYKRPELMLNYLKEVKQTQSQNIRARVTTLLESKETMFAFDTTPTKAPDIEYVQGLVAEVERLSKERDELLNERNSLRASLGKITGESNARISDLQKRCANLRTDNEALEKERASLVARLEQIEPRLKRADAQIHEFDQMLMQLNGRIYEMLAQPIIELEKLYFNLNDYTDMMDPKGLASFLVEPIGRLREGLENIHLNNSKVKILDRDYAIQLLPCADFDDWADRNPVDFDPEKHILMIGKAKQVYIITRGFSYTNNLGNTEIIKAEVRPADDSNDQGGAD